MSASCLPECQQQQQQPQKLPEAASSDSQPATAAAAPAPVPTHQGSHAASAGCSVAEGCRFFDASSDVWSRFPQSARFNPPQPTLPLPYQFYGQPFYKGFTWEKKVSSTLSHQRGTRVSIMAGLCWQLPPVTAGDLGFVPRVACLFKRRHPQQRRPLFLNSSVGSVGLGGGAGVGGVCIRLRFKHLAVGRSSGVSVISAHNSRRRLTSSKNKAYDAVLGFGPIPYRQRSTFGCSCNGKDHDVKDDESATSLQDEADGRNPFTLKAVPTFLTRWDVPWDGKATAIGMASWCGSFLFTGFAVSLLTLKLGLGRRQSMDMDEQALFIFVHQLLQTATGLGAISLVISPYKPLPPTLFVFDFKSPLDLERGWLLWGSLGVLLAGASVVAAGAATSVVTGEPPPRDEADALMQLLPLIGSTPASTASLIAVAGVLAPLLEESVFRGFLLTSLTKWVPTPVAIAVSASAFALAHLTPSEFPQLFALGVVLGLSYAQTRNLLTPIFIHAVWNSGVVILLTLLRLEGYDIREML